MGNFVITSGEPFVIKSDMYFQKPHYIHKSISSFQIVGKRVLYLPMVTLYSGT